MHIFGDFPLFLLLLGGLPPLFRAIVGVNRNGIDQEQFSRPSNDQY